MPIFDSNQHASQYWSVYHICDMRSTHRIWSKIKSNFNQMKISSKFNNYIFITATIFTPQDDILSEIESAMDVKQSLDEISREVDELKTKLTNDGAHDGDGSSKSGQQTNAATGEIDKIRKIVELLETVVLPIVVDKEQNAQKPAPPKIGQPVAAVASVASDPIKILPKGLRLLQHHSGLISDLEDGPQLTIEKTILQADDK